MVATYSSWISIRLARISETPYIATANPTVAAANQKVPVVVT